MSNIKRKYSQEEVWTLMHGQIYYSKNDLNIFVKKKTPYSYTMNLGNIWSYVISIALAAIILSIFYLLLH